LIILEDSALKNSSRVFVFVVPWSPRSFSASSSPGARSASLCSRIQKVISRPEFAHAILA